MVSGERSFAIIFCISCSAAFGITLSEFFAEEEKTSGFSGAEKELILMYRKLSEKDKNAVMTLITNLQ